MLAGKWDDGGGTIVKRSMIYTALAVLALSTPAAAQGYQPGARPPGAMPPYEILTMVRSTGFDPIGQPVRRGPNYVLRAIDDTDREVNLVINARTGDILSVTPIQTASRMPPGVSMGPYERMPPGYVPPGGRGSYSLPDTDDDEDDVPPRNYGAPRPPGAVPGPLPRSSNAAPPPRGGAMQPDDDEASPPSRSGAPNVIPADPDRNGVLPPPPERFPQRVAPAAPPKPKPVTRAAAAPPKAAPLPKPKPGATADAPPAPAQQAPAQQSWPSPPEPARAPAKSPAAEETPN
jgi:hypothetical protein